MLSSSLHSVSGTGTTCRSAAEAGWHVHSDWHSPQQLLQQQAHLSDPPASMYSALNNDRLSTSPSMLRSLNFEVPLLVKNFNWPSRQPTARWD